MLDSHGVAQLRGDKEFQWDHNRFERDQKFKRNKKYFLENSIPDMGWEHMLPPSEKTFSKFQINSNKHLDYVCLLAKYL
jgi:hypothetical protein